MNILPHVKFPIADLHCDLLWYLSLDSKRTANDRQVRCSIPHLKEGGVKIQTMAIFTETNANSVESGIAQGEIFKKLPKLYPDSFQFIRQTKELTLGEQSDKIGIVPAIENASAVCGEAEELSLGLERLTAMQRKIGKLLYVSLTWNHENRFGGGALTKVGLKADGKELVDYLYAKGIALDFSHTSDYLAYDLLNYIDKKGWRLPILASHSNMRAIAEAPRNLPDDIAKEIIQRAGVIGFNFIRSFLGGNSPRVFSRHLEYLLKFRAEKNICFGADFFCAEDLPAEIRKPPEALFFPSYDHAGAYGKVVEAWKKELLLPDPILKDLCYGNYVRFVRRVIFSEPVN